MHSQSACSDVNIFQALYNFVPIYPYMTVYFEETIINLGKLAQLFEKTDGILIKQVHKQRF